jgi:hypothetical protein
VLRHRIDRLGRVGDPWSLGCCAKVLHGGMGSAGYGVRPAVRPAEALPGRLLPPKPAVHRTAGQALDAAGLPLEVRRGFNSL